MPETKSVPVAGFDAQLQGKAAGLQINSNNGVNGDGVFVQGVVLLLSTPVMTCCMW